MNGYIEYYDFEVATKRDAGQYTRNAHAATGKAMMTGSIEDHHGAANLHSLASNAHFQNANITAGVEHNKMSARHSLHEAALKAGKSMGDTLHPLPVMA